ncbi:MAG: carboxypeptidase regulatory-like domain-containing protein [Gemmatimonadaceae bacterium]|nr:carboxypeptidase regulatory-like domain-containing protein [Gemmatimonadaceae bacterium]
MSVHGPRALAGALLGTFLLALPLASQVTTATLAGIVRGPGGTPVAEATVRAVHVPSGSAYGTTTRGDGSFRILNMRVGGPYRVTVRAIGYAPETQDDISLALGTTTDLAFLLRQQTVTLQTVVVSAGPADLGSSRTGAATRVTREAIAQLPTINRNMNDFARTSPFFSGNSTNSMSFAGVSNRLNNITIDGSFFNNSFGLQGQPGARTGVAAISPEAIDQLQVNIAPYDVRQGNFVGAGVNAVTRSGTNSYAGSVYRIQRDQGLVGTRAGAVPFNPGTFDFGLWGGWASGPIVKDRLFFFANVEDDLLGQPGTIFRANAGGEPVSGNTTRVLASDLQQLSGFLAQNFRYQTGPAGGYEFGTPSRRLLAKLDANLGERHKASLRYTQLDSRTDVTVSSSNALGFAAGRGGNPLDFLSFQNSNYAIGENIRSIVGEWNAQLTDRLSNNLIVGYTTNDESRDFANRTAFPFVDILQQNTAYTSFGLEPFTPLNQLRYNTLQLQNNLTLALGRHELTAGIAGQRYRSENVFFPGSQSVYVYNSLQDFYTDANDYLANPNRTTSPVSLARFQLRYNNVPGLSEPLQPLDVFYGGAYLQDDFRPFDNLRLTIGVRADVPVFRNTGYTNPQANTLTFRDPAGNPAQFRTEKLPDANVLWSPRVGVNWDVTGTRRTVLRGGTGLFTGPPSYVWISNQIGQNGILTGFIQQDNTRAFPFNPNPTHYAPANVTGAPAASYELNFTDPDFRFPQVWRSNVAIDQRLPLGFVGTAEFLYSRDVNGVAYFNANLPAPTAAYAGPDQRPRYTVQRVNPNITGAFVLTNQNVGYNWNWAVSLQRNFVNGLFVTGGYRYGVARNTFEPTSIAAGSWNSNPMPRDPNNPPVGFSGFSPGRRVFGALSFRREYFRVGATTLSLFVDGATQGNGSYTFANDANGDGGANDLLYVPRGIEEMRFQDFTLNNVTYTAAQQAAAWEAYIAQDPYLRRRRGQYAERGAAFLPMVIRADAALAQDIFTTVMGKRHSLQVRLDVFNVGNLLNRDWGVGDRFVNTQPLTNASLDPATGELQYRLRVVNGQLMTTTFQKTANLLDVYRMQLTFRYNFQ